MSSPGFSNKLEFSTTSEDEPFFFHTRNMNTMTTIIIKTARRTGRRMLDFFVTGGFIGFSKESEENAGEA